MILTNIRTYVRGFIDATLLGTVICFGIAYWEQKEKNDILQDRIDEQSQLIQRFGWPENKNQPSHRSYSKPSYPIIPQEKTIISYSKIPKEKTISKNKPENPIGFC